MSITRIPASLLSGGSGSAASAFINPESYGMKAVGVAGASAALNKAALEAALAAGPVLLPPKTYDITGIVFTGRMVLIGCGMTSVLNVTSTGAGSAGIHVLIPAPNVGTILRDFAITAPVANACIHGIKFEQTHADGFMANWEISGIYLWQTFASAAIYLDNHIASGDGFFTGIIEKCRMTTGSDAGILGQLIGDSIIIRKNTISDGIGVAINCSQVSGARQLIIEDNNLTSRNGQIYLGACAQAIVNRNWCEHPAYLGEFVGPPAILSQITLADCYMCEVSYCTIAGGSGRPGPDGVTPVNGSSYGVRLVGTTTLCVVGPRNWISAVGVAKISDTSSGSNQQINTGQLANVLA